jgi:hypothetical protein
VVAERDRVRSRTDEPVGEARRDPDAVRGVLAVDDAHVDLELVSQPGKPCLERPATGCADDVRDEQDAQRRAF